MAYTVSGGTMALEKRGKVGNFSSLVVDHVSWRWCVDNGEASEGLSQVHGMEGEQLA